MRQREIYEPKVRHATLNRLTEYIWGLVPPQVPLSPFPPYPLTWAKFANTRSELKHSWLSSYLYEILYRLYAGYEDTCVSSNRQSK